MNFRKFLNVCLLVAFLGFMSASGALAQVGQAAPLPSKNIPQFVDPLPLLNVAPQNGTIETLTNGTASIYMHEFQANILPTGFVPPGIVAPATFTGTWVWGYRTSPTAPTTAVDTYIGPVFVVPRGTASSITWVNNLPTSKAGSNVPFWWASTDQTLHWADPLNSEANDCNMTIQPGLPPVSPCNQNYDGPVPAVVHLHGGEVPPQLDGGPDAWFLSTAPTTGTQQGHAYYSYPLGAANAATYKYPNTQEAAPIWFHDHVLGVTRLNVYAGLAGGYIIWDPATTSVSDGGSCTTNCLPSDLGKVSNIIPLAIQDRMFDVNGQLFFPNIGLNPEHPFWVPEFVGDAILVNGKTWPYLEVQPNQRYRFLFINGSNARTYTLNFKIQGKGKSPTFWVISTDGGYLDKPVAVPQLTIMPGERYGVIVDFAGFTAGTKLLLQNSARTPFPGGAPVNGATTGRVMEFRVTTTPAAPVAPTVTFNPATATGTNPLRLTNPIERLAPTIVTPAQNATQFTPIRRLTLNEVMGPGGPLEILVNNTKWSGESARTYNDFVPVTTGGITTMYSELPKEGATEVWEVINMTADAHPIHLHLVQFQLLSRQPYDARKYIAAYDAAFPGGIYRPAFGPPLPYAPVVGGVSDPTRCSDVGTICGGNPDPGALGLLLGVQAPPLPQEQGWKDTVIMYPGEVTRIAVRWAPQDASTAGNYFAFNPNGGHGFVWHCHIIDHEDNEMMRPDLVQPTFSGTRAVQGPNGPHY